MTKHDWFQLGCALLTVISMLFARWYGRWYGPAKRPVWKHSAVCLAFLLFLYTATISLFVWYGSQIIVFSAAENAHVPVVVESGPGTPRESGRTP